MRIKVIEIEATSDDLRQSKSLSDAFTNAFRNSFEGVSARRYWADDDEEEGEEADDE